MAKKPTPKKAPKAPKPSKAKKGKPARTAKTRPRVTLPKAAALPGMEDVRIPQLDDICHSIAECRATMNAAREEEAGLEQTALTMMRRHQRDSWRAYGVELVRVPGEEKLRVRTTRERTATAEVAEARASESADDLDLDELHERGDDESGDE